MSKNPCFIFFISFLFFFIHKTEASSSSELNSISQNLVFTADSSVIIIPVLPTDSINKTGLSKKEIRKKKMIAAAFAFPFPFGFMGAHRVVLGTKPWVPIVYIATFGGCFGVIPLIDFFVIIFSKDELQYENNSKVFMWVK